MIQITQTLGEVITLARTSPTTKQSCEYGDWRKSEAYYLPIVRGIGLDGDAATLLAKVKRHGFKGDKGCILGGCVGNGKTTRLKFIANALFVEYRDARDLCNDLAGVAPSDDRFKDLCNLQRFGRIEGDKWHLAHDLIIDDLGTEAGTINHYGTSADVMANVIAARYREWEERGWRTFIATNLSSADLQRAYGERTYSRLRGMCEFIRLQGGDRRAAR